MPVWVCGIKWVILLVVTSTWCRFPALEPTECKQVSKQSIVLKDINLITEIVQTVCHCSEFDFFLCFYFVLNTSWRTGLKIFLSVVNKPNIFRYWNILVFDCFDWILFAVKELTELNVATTQPRSVKRDQADFRHGYEITLPKPAEHSQREKLIEISSGQLSSKPQDPPPPHSSPPPPIAYSA